MPTPPNPGTQESIDAGCKCPVIDNHYGNGYHGKKDTFIFTVGCHVHPYKLKDVIKNFYPDKESDD